MKRSEALATAQKYGKPLIRWNHAVYNTPCIPHIANDIVAAGGIGVDTMPLCGTKPSNSPEYISDVANFTGMVCKKCAMRAVEKLSVLANTERVTTRELLAINLDRATINPYPEPVEPMCDEDWAAAPYDHAYHERRVGEALCVEAGLCTVCGGEHGGGYEF